IEELKLPESKQGSARAAEFLKQSEGCPVHVFHTGRDNHRGIRSLADHKPITNNGAMILYDVFGAEVKAGLLFFKKGDKALKLLTDLLSAGMWIFVCRIHPGGGRGFQYKHVIYLFPHGQRQR